MLYQNPFMRARASNLLAIPQRQNPMTPPRPEMRFGAGPSPQEPVERDDSGDYFNEMTTLQNRMGPGLQAYKQYLSQMPSREQYKPGIMNRIAAALSGIGAGFRDPGKGVETAAAVNDMGYNNAMADYANRGVGLKEQASLEQDELDSKLRMLQNARAMGLKYDEFKLKQLESQSKMDNDRTTADAAYIRAQAYAESQRRPGYDATPQQDGSVLYVNKQDPSKTIVVKANTIAAGQLGVARKNAETNVRRANTYATSVSETGRHNLEMEKRPVGGRSSPDQQQDAEDMALDELAMDPDFKDFIVEEGGSGFGPFRKPGYKVPAEDDGSKKYRAFLDALNAKTAEILSGHRTRTRSMGR